MCVEGYDQDYCEYCRRAYGRYEADELNDIVLNADEHQNAEDNIHGISITLDACYDFQEDQSSVAKNNFQMVLLKFIQYRMELFIIYLGEIASHNEL